MTLSPPASSPIAPARREPTQWPLFMVVGLVALGALTWVLRPDLLGPATNTAQPTASKAVDGGEKPGAKFADLYEHYGVAPIDAAIAASPAVDPVLASLQREPCDRQLVYKADLALEKAHATRAAAELLRGVGSLCADAQGELYRASELFLSLGDFDAAARASGDVIQRQPDAQRAYYVHALAEQGRHNYAVALVDFVTLIRVLPDLKAVKSEVFTRLSEVYEKLDRPCEAITPLQTYMAIDPERRTVRPLERRIADLAVKGAAAPATHEAPPVSHNGRQECRSPEPRSTALRAAS